MISENEFYAEPIPNSNVLSYLVAVFDLNSNFSNFPIATGKKWCGGMRMFGPWHTKLSNSSVVKLSHWLLILVSHSPISVNANVIRLLITRS